MKKISLLFFLLVSFGSFAQGLKVQIEGNIFFSGDDSIRISQNFGSYYRDYIVSPFDKKGNFELTGIVPGPDYYLLRFGSQMLHVVIRDTNTIKIYADGRKIASQCNFVNSEESRQMHEYVLLTSSWQQKTDSALAAIKTDKSKEAAINQYMTEQFKQYVAILKELYDEDVLDEEIILKWGADPKSAAKFGVELETSQAVRKQVKPFLEWLAQDDSDSD